MTEKERIILKHTRLAEEYSRLANSDSLLSAKEWESINVRMTEILAEINKLREIERTWEEFQSGDDKEETNLKMLSINDVCEILNVSRQQITMLREIGIINAIKTGKNYMFTKEEIQRFQRDYVGYDISNREKALKAYNIVNGDVNE